MDSKQQRWAECLKLIREKIADEHVFNVWYADILIENYDEPTNTITLILPSRYVYEYIEQYGVRVMAWALSSAFRPGIKLQYRIKEKASFVQIVDHLRQQGFDTGTERVQINIPDARQQVEQWLRHFVGDDYKWLPAYDRVVDWLTDNKGRGLLCIGRTGLGKTLLCKRILPNILGHRITSVTANEMNRQIKDLLKEKYVIIDDLGKEDPMPSYFNTRQRPFFELCNAAEQESKLLIITTNLSTTPAVGYSASIRERYGEEVLDRLKSIVKPVVFEGGSLRG